MQKESKGSSLPLGSNSPATLAVFAAEKDKAFKKIAALLLCFAYEGHRAAGYTPVEKRDDTGRGFWESELDSAICTILGLPVLCPIAVASDLSHPCIILNKYDMHQMKNKTVAELERIRDELEKYWKATGH